MSPRGDTRYYTEIPSSLKQVARLVVRGFYTIEDALIIDMLVRNPCMKEDDIAELLRFERKQLRARIATLRNDKFIQTRLKMETGPDAKAQKVSYYFINYKTFVNVVKYKLDLMRKRMETEERDATSRASFKCTNCFKTFTDLEADHLFDVYTGEFRCTICRRLVEEDAIEMPKNSRLMLARFNEQLHPLYDLLREVEGITLAPELLEPEPVDIDTIRGLNKSNGQRPDTMQWSGEATRNKGFAVEETRVNVTIGEDDDAPDFGLEAKARPIWMSESTVLMENHKEMDATLNETTQTTTTTTTLLAGSSSSSSNSNRNKRETEDIMSVLLQYEDHPEKRKSTAQWMLFLSEANSAGTCSGNENCDDDNKTASTLPSVSPTNSESEIDDDIPVVYVCGCPFSLNELTDILISQMTQLEKESYIHVCQDYYNSIYE